MRVNEHGQPIGDALPGWKPPEPLAPVTLEGLWVTVEPLDPRHADELYDATCGPGREPVWTYLGDDMPATHSESRSYVERRAAEPASLALRPRGSGVQGVASWMRVDPANGSAEVGGIVLGPGLQRSTAATEAMWLMARHAFAMGYRRYEWKCDALNAPSMSAATRLGFRFEGIFRNAVVLKGRNRDTAWFSITDQEWRSLEPAYAQWLDPRNFDDPVSGTGQHTSLSALTRAAASDAGTAFPHVGTRATLA